MHTFEITIQRKLGDRWPVVALEEQGDGSLPIRKEGVLDLDVARLERQDAPRAYGMFLGEALFEDENIRDAFTHARSVSTDRLHVRLFIETDDLKNLRWERLCAPLGSGRWDYLSLNQGFPFSIYLPSTTDRRFPPIGRQDLRALILAASPDGLSRYSLDSFDVGAAIKSVQESLDTIPCDILSTCGDAVGPPTLNALCDQLTSNRYTLLHLVCHGQLVEETVLYLADAEQGTDPVTETSLIRRLSQIGGQGKGLPYLAFLSACESGRPESADAAGSLAHRLVRELGIPAVIAMTESVSMDTAQLLSKNFYKRLNQHGEVDRALVEACAGLADREDIHVPALYSRLGGRPLFSDAPNRQLTTQDIESGLNRLRELLDERAPSLRPEFDAHAEALRHALRSSSPNADGGRERAAALAEISAISLEVLDLDFEALAVGDPPPPYDSRCPFRGLYPFKTEDQEFFFGREALIERLRERLWGNNFLAVLGPSGSGKSSVVLAGLIPAIKRDDPESFLIYLTPGQEPLATLRNNVAGVEFDRRAVIVVDQFEELFTHGVGEGERRAFLKNLLSLSEHSRVVLTMRADFWGDCAPYTELKELMQANQELIAPMGDGELRSAMESQAARVGLRFEADLSAHILDDVRGEPGAMPLLQHALQELWKRRHGRWLRAEEYREIGGVMKSIARTADEVYERLGGAEKDRIREIFLRLTRIDELAEQGDERRDTRQRVLLSSLVPAEGDEPSTKALVKLLADARLVVTNTNSRTGKEEVEIAHEALIRHWPKLRDWLDRDRVGLIMHRRLTKAAEEWVQNGRDSSYLYDGVRLGTAKRWAQDNWGLLNLAEREFLFCGIVEEGSDVGEWAGRYGSVDQTLALAEKFLSAPAADDRVKGLSILRWLSDPESPDRIDGLLLRTALEDASLDVSLPAARALCERGRAEWLVEQLNGLGDKRRQGRLIYLLGYCRNLPGIGLRIEQAAQESLTPAKARAVRYQSFRRLLKDYKAQFAIILSFTFLSVEISLQIISRLSYLTERLFDMTDGRASLPYGTFSLITTAMCGLYVLLRAHIWRRSVTTGACLRVGFYSGLLSEAIFVLGRIFEAAVGATFGGGGGNFLSSVVNTLLGSLDTIAGMMIAALFLRIVPRRGSQWKRLLLLSAGASAMALIWRRAVTPALWLLLTFPGIGYDGTYDLSNLLPGPLLLSWILGITITMACFVGFRAGLPTAFEPALFQAQPSLGDGPERRTPDGELLGTESQPEV